MDAAETRRRMEEGRLYSPEDESILKEQTQCLLQLYRFNMTRPDEPEKRKELLSEMFAEIGEGCYIEPPNRFESPAARTSLPYRHFSTVSVIFPGKFWRMMI